MDFKQKYLKYKQKYHSLAKQKNDIFVQNDSFKNKYLELKNQYGGEEKCPFWIGQRVKILKNDENFNKSGLITYLQFVQSNSNPNDNICVGAKINLGGVEKKYSIRDIQTLPDLFVDLVLFNIPIGKLIEMYRIATSDKERTAISDIEYDFYEQPIPVDMSLAQFRKIFPKAIGINLNNHRQISDHDFIVSIKPIVKLNMSGCNQITDAAFVHLRGIKELNMSGCHKITNAAFVHLTGIQTLDMTYCNQITDAAIVHLKGIQKLYMSGCDQITNDAFVNLRGIHTLDMNVCRQITNAAFVNLRGIHTLLMSSCHNITDAAIVNLRGIHTLNIDSCWSITDAAFVHLRGIHTLDMTGCNQITAAAIDNLVGIERLQMRNCKRQTIDYAAQLGLPVEVSFKIFKY